MERRRPRRSRRVRTAGRAGWRAGSGGLNGPNANPVASIIALKDSISLTTEQLAKLQPLSDSVAARNKVVSDEVQKIMKDGGANPDMAALFSKIRPKLEASQRERATVLKEVQGILTPEQWEKVPQRIRNPQQGGPGGQRRPPGGE